MGECKFKKKEGNNSNNKKEKTARQVCQSRNTSSVAREKLIFLISQI